MNIRNSLISIFSVAIFSAHCRTDIFNADNYGLQYKIPTDTLIAVHPSPVHIKQKEKYTVMVCCSSDSTQIFDLMFIDHPKRSGALKKR